MPIKLSKLNYGQVFLITIFILSVAMFSSLFALSPIRIKVLQIKEMEYIYQSFANAEKALEIFTYSLNYGLMLPFNQLDNDVLTISLDDVVNTTTCAYYNTSTLGTCQQTSLKIYNNSFKANSYRFATDNNSFFSVVFYSGSVRNFSRVIIEAPR